MPGTSSRPDGPGPPHRVWGPALTFASPALERHFLDYLAQTLFLKNLIWHVFLITLAHTTRIVHTIVNEPLPLAGAATLPWDCAAQKEAGVVLPGYPCGRSHLAQVSKERPRQAVARLPRRKAEGCASLPLSPPPPQHAAAGMRAHAGGRQQ